MMACQTISQDGSEILDVPQHLQDHFQTLPSEIFGLIIQKFSTLYEIRDAILVSRSWSQAVQREFKVINFKHIFQGTEGKLSLEEKLKLITRGATYFEDKKITLSAFVSQLHALTHLQTLYLHAPTSYSTDFFKLTQLTALKNLSLGRLSELDGEQTMIALKPSLTRLENLRLSLGRLKWHSFPQVMPHLTQFHCHLESQVDIKDFDALLKNWSGLQKLVLKGEPFLKGLAEGFQNLTRLTSFQFSCSLMDHFQDIVEFTHLKKLVLRTYKVPIMLTSLQNLEKLNLSCDTGEDLHILGELTSLRKLKIDYWRQVITLYFNSFYQLTHLEYLDCSGSLWSQHCRILTQLKFLSLHKNLTPFFEYLGEQFPESFSSLVHLELEEYELDESNFKALDRLPHLQTLRTDCYKITCSLSFPRLERLSLTGRHQMILQGNDSCASHLTHLYISSASHATNLQALTNLQNLKTLQLNLSDLNSALPLVEALSSLRLLNYRTVGSSKDILNLKNLKNLQNPDFCLKQF